MSRERLAILPSSFIAIALVLACLTIPAAAQLYTGSIAGTVTDPSGAVVPAAHVVATDVDKGYTFPGTTDANGHYLLRNIPPGNYTVSVEAPNFESQKKTGAVITVNLNATIDFTLKVGATSQTVEVQATGVELQTQDAVTGQVIDRRAINNLPLVGRDVLQLTFLAPGVVPVAEASHNDEGGTGLNFNSNGGRNSTADFVMDGTSISNIEQNGGTNNVLRAPPVDSIEEFKVQQTNFSAEFGFAGGTVINAITRSGTNAFHGSLHEFWRNQILDANDWFSDAQTPKVPIQPLRRNQFGGAIGGPIRKNKTFFFFDYDGLRLRQFTSNSGAVPTLCERGDPTATCPVGTPALGNFGEICTLQGGTFGTGTDPVTGNTFLNVCQSGGTLLSSGQIWDPYSGISSVGSNGHFATRQTPVAFNNLSTYMNTNAGLPLVPGNLIDPLAQKLFLLFPKPNLSASSPIFEGGTNWSFSGVTPQSDNKWDLKVDHHFNDRNLLSVRYSQENSSSNTADCYGNIADPCSASGPTSGHTYLLAVNYTKTFSPNVLMNITYGGARNFSYTQGIGANIGFSQFKNDLNSLYSLPGQSCNIAAPAAAQCFGAVGLEEGGNLFDNVPNVNISASGGTLGTYNTPGISSTFSILKQGQDTHTVADTVSWLRGKHEFKFGGEFRIARDNFVQPGAPAGQFNFSYIGTSQFSDAGNDGINGSGAPADGGDDLASMLVGVGDPTNGSPPPAGCFNGTGGCFRGFNNAVSTQNWRYAWFFNDNFHATQKLTVNLGLRYELSLPRTERFNRMEWLDPSKPAAIQYNATQLAMINTFNSTPLVPGNPATTPTALGIPSPTVLHGAEVFVGQNGASRYNYNPYYNAIQPRIGLAWQLPNNFGVLRTGYGIYYDAPRSAVSGTGPVGFDGFDIQPPWLTVDASNVPNQVPCGRLSNPNGNPVSGCNTSNLAFPTPPGNTLGAFNNLGFGANGPIPIINSKIPYEQSWSLGLQKQLPSKILLDMNYIGKKGTHLYAGGFNTLQLLGRPFEKAVLSGALTPADINTINQESVANPFASPTACSNPPNTNYICSTTSGEGSIVPTIGATQLLTPFPQFAFFGGDAFPVADSTYHALQVRAERAFANGLEFLVTYTWSKSIDNVSFQDFSNQFLGNGGGTNSLQDPFNPRGDRAVSVFDIPQLLQLSYEYELPIGRGKAFGGNWNPILNAIVGGWRTSGIWTVSDGRPLTLTGSNASIPTYGQRPNLSAPLKRSSTSYQRLINGLPNTAPTASYFSNPNALSVAPNFTFGNAPRTITSVLSPGIRNAELALFKEFQIREGIQIEFRAEATNALNHPQFIPPDTDITSGTFGQIVPGGGGFSSGSGAVTINSPRELQLGLKLYF